MNDPHNLETRLGNTPMRRVPPAWREEILEAANRAARPEFARPPAFSLVARFRAGFFAMLWPHPRAWAGLAALWLMILTLNLAARDTSRGSTPQAHAPSPEVMALLRQQEKLFIELAGLAEIPQAVPPKPATPKSHSQNRKLFLNT